MLESEAQVAALQRLLDASHARSTSHLRSIIDDGRTLSAPDIVRLLAGMKVITLATTTARGEPRISALDGHFLHATWTFGTSGGSAQARHLEARPQVSIAHVDGERLAVFSHGTAQRMQADDRDWDETLDHWTAHYGSSPLSWGDDVRMYRYHATWMVGYTADRAALLREHRS